ncbi:MAG: sugar transferase [Lachnospirales bacterium]
MYKENKINRKSGSILKILEAILYLIIVNGSYLFLLYFDLTNKYTEENIIAYKNLWIYITITAIVAFLFNKVFRTFKLSKTENFFVVVSSTLMIAFTTMMFAFFVRSFALPRSIILYGFFIQTFVIYTIKIIMKIYSDTTKKVKNVAIYCDLDEIELCIEKIFSKKDIKEKLIFVSSNKNFNTEYVKNIEKVYIFSNESSVTVVNKINKFILQGIEVCILPSSYELTITNADLYLRSDVLMLKVDKLSLSDEYKIVKRTFDIVFSVIMIIITLPIMVIVAIAIFISDGGNPIFKQKRVTINNKIFNVYKFRTMILDAEKETGAVWATENDPRITKLGSFLRKFWLDELPQLFNIIKGDMSVVGPRPERPELIETFIKDYPDFKFRTYVKCGLTGYAQVLAKYDTTPKNKLKFDMYYILKADLVMDLNIILLTIRLVILRLIRYNIVEYNYNEIMNNWNIDNIDDKGDVLVFNYK